VALANEHEKVAIAIGETMVNYEPKLAIAHNVAVALGYVPGSMHYMLFRRTVLNAHRRVKAEWQDA